MSGLADLMTRYEILKLELPMGESCFRIRKFPLEYLHGILRGLRDLGFHIDRQ